MHFSFLKFYNSFICCTPVDYDFTPILERNFFQFFYFVFIFKIYIFRCCCFFCFCYFIFRCCCCCFFYFLFCFYFLDTYFQMLLGFFPVFVILYSVVAVVVVVFVADFNNKHSWHLFTLAIVPSYFKAQDTCLMPLSLSCSRTAFPGLRRGRARADLVAEARYSGCFLATRSIEHPT